MDSNAKHSHPQPDWDPTSTEVQRHQRAAYDETRRRCPVAHSGFMGWSLFRHEDMARVLHDHKTFSNAVSQHLSVPNGMDRPEHTAYRRVIEPYFSAKRMAAFEPICRGIAGKLIKDLSVCEEVEFIAGRGSAVCRASAVCVSGLAGRFAKTVGAVDAQEPRGHSRPRPQGDVGACAKPRRLSITRAECNPPSRRCTSSLSRR